MSKFREVEGTYGSGRTRSTIFVADNNDGSHWYVAEGASVVNRTYDDIEDGVHIEELSDHDVFTWPERIKSLDDFQEAVEYGKGGKIAHVRKDIISKGEKVPVGDKYYGGKKPLEYKWEGEEFLVKLDGKWLKAESVDWEFEKGGKAGVPKSISDVGLKLDDVTADSGHGDWTQLCKKHADVASKSKLGYLSPEGEGSGICGVVGCDQEADYYFNFKTGKKEKGGKAGSKKMPTWDYAAGAEYSPDQVLKLFREKALDKYGKKLSHEEEIELMEQAKEQHKHGLDIDNIYLILDDNMPSSEEEEEEEDYDYGKPAYGGAFVFDDGGDDGRYTVVFEETGEVYSISYPHGVSKRLSNVTDRQNITFGYGWRKGHDEKSLARILKSELGEYLSQARADKDMAGKEIRDAKDLPEKVKKYIDMFKDESKMEAGGKVTSKDLLDKLKAGEKIAENEVLLIKNRMNNNRTDEHSEELIQWIWDNQPELTPEQNKKGIDFLMNLWKSPTGKIRSSSPFGTREENALETFKYFTLDGFHDISRWSGRSFYVPIYSLVGDKGIFQYYYDGKVNIIGAKGGEMGKRGSDFWSNYANDGALITGGSYSNREKKEFGGFLLGLGVGTVGTWIYKDRVRAAKEKAKWKLMYAIDRLGKGGEAGNLTAEEKSAIKSHLAGMDIKESSANKIISMLNDVRSGDRYVGDVIEDSGVTIGDIVESLQLNQFVPAEVMASGGGVRPASAVARERKYTARGQEHEMNYKDQRKSRVRYYKKGD